MQIVRDLVIRKRDAAVAKQQVAFGAVYAPGVIDSQRDFMRADEIRKAAYDFLRRGTTDAIDTQHDNQKNGAYVVESSLSKKGDPDFPIEGTWVVGIHVPNEELWGKIEKGEIGGLSMEVVARRIPDQDAPTRKNLFVNGKAKGRTFKTGDHEHEYEVSYGPNGEFLGGRTTPAEDGHFHIIKGGVTTEEHGDHRHRFSTLEHFEEDVAA